MEGSWYHFQPCSWTVALPSTSALVVLCSNFSAVKTGSNLNSPSEARVTEVISINSLKLHDTEWKILQEAIGNIPTDVGWMKCVLSQEVLPLQYLWVTAADSTFAQPRHLENRKKIIKLTICRLYKVGFCLCRIRFQSQFHHLLAMCLSPCLSTFVEKNGTKLDIHMIRLWNSTPECMLYISKECLPS